MKRYVAATVLGIVLIMALSPFAVFADDGFGIYGPQPLDEKYYYWGSDLEPPYVRNGLTLTLDPTSTSYQSIKAVLTVDHQLIDERDIQYFAILANGVYVDYVEAYFDNSLDPPRYREYYSLDIDISNQYIGSDVYMQALAVHVNPDGSHYVVGWSEQTETIRFKPLPVIDRDAIQVLNAILAKLEQLRADLSSKLDQLNASIREIYEIKPTTQARFDAALANLQTKLPTEQIKDQVNQAADLMDESADRVRNAQQRITFGEINWMGVVTTPLLDFTEFADVLDKLRSLMALLIWCEFFFFVISILTPKLTA
jgi:hypothetical protein